MTTPRPSVFPLSVLLAACLLGPTAFAAPPADAPVLAQQDEPPAATTTPNPAMEPAPPPPAAPAPERLHGAFVGDEWRYPHHNILVRWLTDIVAIPTSFVTWSPQDVATFALIGGGGVALMVGNPPGDVYVQRWAHETFGLRGQRFTFWWPQTDMVIWGTLGATALGLLTYGWLFDGNEYVEMVSIILEGFSAAQVFHVVPKLLFGREGPMDGNGNAVVYGPTHALQLYPAGTPSGHAASIYSIIGALSMYTSNGWILAGMHLVGAFLSATMLIDDYHFLSDILWGAAEGYATGQWVVRHRSTHFHDESPGYPVRVVPVVDLKNGAAALAVGMAF